MTALHNAATTIHPVVPGTRLPPPGSANPARLTVAMHDLIWEALYAPIGRIIAFATERINVLQFLTIRRYLTLVFAALVLLLLVLAI